MTKRFGFTLAEVLITLGIIGVVAAMSIPTLISNTNSAKFSAQYKKTLASLNQAALMAQAQYDTDFAAASAANATTNNKLNPAKADNLSVGSVLMGTLAGASYYDTIAGLKGNDGTTAYAVAEQKSGVVTGATKIVKLADGSIFAFNGGKITPAAVTNGVSGCSLVEPGTSPLTYIPQLVTNGCVGFIDVNGATLPNRETVCADGNAKTSVDTCRVPKDSAHMRDIYPVVFHDGVIEPATDAARAVLSAAK